MYYLNGTLFEGMISLTSKWPFVSLQLRPALVALQQRGEVAQRHVARLRGQQDVVADAVQRAAAGLHLALQSKCEAAVARGRCEQPLRQSRVLFSEQGYLRPTVDQLERNRPHTQTWVPTTNS